MSAREDNSDGRLDQNRHPNFTYPRSQTRASSKSDEHMFSQRPLHPSDPSSLNEKSLPYTDHNNQSSMGLDPPPKLRGDLSTNGSSGESLIDLYRNHKSNVPAVDGVDSRWSQGDPESSRWIHRDKLTMIEIQEYRDRGMDVPPELLRRAGIQGPRKDERANGHRIRDHAKPQPERPTTSEDESDEPFIPNDPRTPEEIAANPYEEDGAYPYYSPGLKSSSSRIPLSTSSPLPVPIEHLERNAPLPRKRGASGQFDDDGLYYNKTRSRSHSAASQALLDEADGRSNVGSVPSSPEKAKQAKIVSKKPGSRNVSASKSRTTSLANRGSPSQRPGTRSGPDGRPMTATHRPEGDPPWLATMYKPDPRLPPDQQMLPTHAKRMMQEQWGREGKAGSAFDREFEPVAVHPETAIHPETPPQRSQQVPTPSPSPPQAELQPDMTSEAEPSADKPKTELAWPLRQGSVAEQKSPTLEHAGYSTMPKVQHTPSLGAVPSPRRVEPPAQHEATDEKKKKKEGGCGCCIVM